MMHTIVTQIAIATLFLTVVSLHLVKKNLTEVMTYCVQSLSIVALLVTSIIDTHSKALIVVTCAVLLVKVTLAPMFLTRLIRRHQLRFTASSYLNTPVTLLAVVLVLLLSQSSVLAPLTQLEPVNHTYLVLALASILTSILLMVNRKGTLSEVIGVLSLENSIVAFGILAGLEQSVVLQTGILFDVSVWVIIATMLISMVYRHIGSIDVTNMKQLKD